MSYFIDDGKKGRIPRPALCHKCARSDCILMLDALAATTVAHIAGIRVVHAPKDVDVPERWVVVMCTRCNIVLGVPHIVRVGA